MFIDDDEELMRRFYTDAVNSTVFNTPVSYLQKYEQIEDYEIIVHTEQELLRLLYLVVSQQVEKAAKISELLASESLDQRINLVVSPIIANKYPDIRRELIRKEICRGGPCLLDHNWRIINVMTTNWTACSNKILLNLILIVEDRNSVKGEKRINLELNVHEVEQLLNKLKEIKKALKA